MGFTAADLQSIIAAHPNRATATLQTLATLDGIYINPSRNAALYNASLNGTDPLFTCRTVDVETHELGIGSFITINAIDYIITDLDSRNDGTTALSLQKDIQ